jgi:C-terminal processing protease CtpA/Prc
LITDPKKIGLWNGFKSYEIVYKKPQNNKIVTVHSSSGFISKFLMLKDLTADYAFKTIDENIGYLVFNRFEKPEKSKQFLNHTFNIIKKEGIKDLIIDMRNNEGGHSIIGDELMQYIAKEPFSVMNSMETKISKELVEKKYKSWFESKKESIGTVEKYKDMERIALKDIPLRFNGNCFLLISGRTYSAGSGFASAFQCANIGKVIGSETGGLMVTFGDVYSFELPKTKCPINVSWKKFYYPCGEENRRGVIQDYGIENSIEDEIKNRDIALEYTIKLING